MSKHTPGPWTANKPTRDNGRAEIHAGCMLVAQAFNWMLDAEGDEQCWADAHLIAAAPDLLEALKEIVDAADGAGWEQLDPSFKKARTAIAKATGEQA